MDAPSATRPQPPEYPVRVGSMLFTLVDPHRGQEVAYNRWYERDHFYAGCLVGPWLFAGKRWVATRPLKDLRFPADSTVAVPVDAGSYLATYWIHEDRFADHFAWANKEVFKLYEAGRGFNERTHAHTALYTFGAAHYRDADPVPVDLALDHPFAGLASIFVDRADGVSHADLDAWIDGEGYDGLLGDGSPVAIAATWEPVRPKGDTRAPMDLGSGPGGPERSMLLAFLTTDPATAWPTIEAWSGALEGAGIGAVRFAGGFLPTIPGTDTYSDELWGDERPIEEVRAEATAATPGSAS
jgi:hypothetical protein